MRGLGLPFSLLFEFPPQGLGWEMVGLNPLSLS